MPVEKRPRRHVMLGVVLGLAWGGAAQAQFVPADMIGRWEARDPAGTTTFVLEPNGNCGVDTVLGVCEVGASIITMRNVNGALTYNYRLQDNTLVFSGGDLDKPLNFARISRAPPPPQSAGRTQPAQPWRNPDAVTTPSQTFTPPAFVNPDFSGQHPVVGRWTGPKGELVVASDGTLSLNGEPPARWQIQGNNLVLSRSSGTAYVPFQVQGNVLTAVSDGEQLIFQRLSGPVPRTARGSGATGGLGGGGHGGGQELVGTWCYVSNINAQGGGRYSGRCFTLNPNGSYTYRSETNTSTAFGGTSSSGSDSGTWRLQGNVLHANSNRQGPQQYNLQKRNHPRNGDPMLCLDGDCYVTQTQRQPW